MLKVFLVEDEFVIREGIKKSINWTLNGYEFCGEASDGELALPMILKLKPDIVITDIKMPFIDGLELSKLIKKELPWIEIIILTGHEKFEYAKEGIEIGVARYLTKPINGEALLNEVNTLAAKIEERRQEQKIKEMYMKEMEENTLKDRKDLFHYLVTGTKAVGELLEMANKLNISLSSMWYNIVLMKINSIHHAHDEYSNSLIEIEQQLEELVDEAKVLIFDRSLEGKAFIFKADSEQELEQVQSEYLGRMKEIFMKYEDVRYFSGIGMPVNRLRELPAAFEKASHAFAHRYLVRGNFFLNSQEMKQVVFLEQEEFSIRNIDCGQIDRSKIKEFLMLGEVEEVVYFVKEYFKTFGTSALKSNIFRQYITMDVYFCAMEFLAGQQLPSEEVENLNPTAVYIHSEEDVIDYIIQIMKIALELRDKSEVNRYGDIANQVLHFIENRYSDEEISLNLLAAQLNFSPSYLSTIFSQEMGQTFSRYLTEYRMNKAKELLRYTDKRSSEVSLEVGYKDPHYFSYLFKKTQGLTPTQYRSKKMGRGEGNAGKTEKNLQ